MKKSILKALQKGSLMVEALAMLGLISMVTPIVYKKASERTAEMQDINEAGYLRIASRALDDYLKDNYNDITGPIEVTHPQIEPYFPEGFNLEKSKMFKELTFKATYKGDPTSETNPKVLTGFVVATPQASTTKLRASRIASMIGTNGGYVDDDVVRGAQGIWSVDTSALIPPADPSVPENNDGTVVTTSIQTIAESAGGEDILYRVDMPSDGSENFLNRMDTNLSLGTNDINDINELNAITGNFTGDLDVDGKATVGTFLSEGAAEITNTLTVTGNFATTLGGTLNVTGAATLDSTLDVTGQTTLEGKATISGGTQAVTASTLISHGGISGNPSLTVTEGANITGGLVIDALEADDLYAKNELGAGLLGDNTYNLTATSNRVTMKEGILTLGTQNSSGKWTGNVNVNSDLFAIEDNNSADDTIFLGEEGQGVEVNRSGDIYSTGKISAPYFYSGDGGYDSSTDYNFQVGTNLGALTGEQKIFEITGSKTDAATITADSKNFSTDVDNTEFNISDSFVIKNSGDTPQYKYNLLVNTHYDEATLSEASVTTQGKVNFMSTETDGRKTLSIGGTISSGGVNERHQVYTHIRDGGIHIAGENPSARNSSHYFIDNLSGTAYRDGDDYKSGYINVDRMVTNTIFNDPQDTTPDGYGKYDVDHYQRYQVNPAYTSVMHDIKLSTRGGARLSDILPDYITKGIYVMDNTYMDYDAKTFNWSDPTFNSAILTLGSSNTNVETAIYSTSSRPTDCGTTDNCEASPWLGFTPAPQCPPGYSKVATITPLRVNMAQVYSLNKTVNATTGEITDVEYVRLVNPFQNHNETLEFQTNTWLNLSLQANNKKADTTPSGGSTGVNEGDATDFRGWHTLMGFIYSIAEYKDFFVKKGYALPSECGTDIENTDCIVWNLFPSYNQELSAIVTTYCYFDRSNFQDELVDEGYNQLTNYRADNIKDGDVYEDRLRHLVISTTINSLLLWGLFFNIF